jgi:hypothetical protein
MRKDIYLIQLYEYVCELYNEELWIEVQRFSNNKQWHLQGMVDEELITIYLFCKIQEQRNTLKEMYDHIKYYWGSWFPKLPSYTAFATRLAGLSCALEAMASLLCSRIGVPCLYGEPVALLGDSMPIITCSHKRNAKVSREIVDKGYCASKSLYYFGVKLHAFAQESPKSLPRPQVLGVTPATTHDLTAARELISGTANAEFFLDKAYCDTSLEEKARSNNSKIFTPHKTPPNSSNERKQRERAYADLSTTAVATRRQPIESLFAWLQNKTSIQKASKVRSTKGLYTHIFGCLAAAIICLFIFNP